MDNDGRKFSKMIDKNVFLESFFFFFTFYLLTLFDHTCNLIINNNALHF